MSAHSTSSVPQTLGGLPSGAQDSRPRRQLEHRRVPTTTSTLIFRVLDGRYHLAKYSLALWFSYSSIYWAPAGFQPLRCASNEAGLPNHREDGWLLQGEEQMWSLSLPEHFCLVVSYYIYFAYVWCVSGARAARVICRVWKSTNDLWEAILTFYHVGPRDWNGSSNLAASTFTHRPF